MDDGHIDGTEGNVDHGYTDPHADARSWSYVVIRVTIGGRNVFICSS